MRTDWTEGVGPRRGEAKRRDGRLFAFCRVVFSPPSLPCLSPPSSSCVLPLPLPSLLSSSSLSTPRSDGSSSSSQSKFDREPDRGLPSSYPAFDVLEPESAAVGEISLHSTRKRRKAMMKKHRLKKRRKVRRSLLPSDGRERERGGGGGRLASASDERTRLAGSPLYSGRAPSPSMFCLARRCPLCIRQ